MECFHRLRDSINAEYIKQVAPVATVIVSRNLPFIFLAGVFFRRNGCLYRYVVLFARLCHFRASVLIADNEFSCRRVGGKIRFGKIKLICADFVGIASKIEHFSCVLRTVFDIHKFVVKRGHCFGVIRSPIPASCLNNPKSIFLFVSLIFKENNLPCAYGNSVKRHFAAFSYIDIFRGSSHRNIRKITVAGENIVCVGIHAVAEGYDCFCKFFRAFNRFVLFSVQHKAFSDRKKARIDRICFRAEFKHRGGNSLFFMRSVLVMLRKETLQQ